MSPRLPQESKSSETTKEVWSLMDEEETQSFGNLHHVRETFSRSRAESRTLVFSWLLFFPLHLFFLVSFFLFHASKMVGGSSAGAGWQKTAACLSSGSAVRCPGTLHAQGSAPLRGGNIWYQLLSGRESAMPFPFSSFRREKKGARLKAGTRLAGRRGATFAHHPSELKEEVTLRCGVA